MNTEIKEEYEIVKALLKQYTPYTEGVERALKLLENQHLLIKQLENNK